MEKERICQPVAKNNNIKKKIIARGTGDWTTKLFLS